MARYRRRSPRISRPELLKEIGARMKAEPGDLLLFVADQMEGHLQGVYALRCKIAAEMKLYDPKAMNFSWVVEFPMFDYDDEEKRWVAMHHPFTAPRDQDLRDARDRSRQVPRKGLRPGDQRLAKRAAARSVFTTRRLSKKCSTCSGIDEESAKERFGFLLEALRLRRASARWHRARHRSLGDAFRRARQHPRLYRLPEDAEGDRLDDGSAQHSRRETAERAGN